MKKGDVEKVALTKCVEMTDLNLSDDDDDDDDDDNLDLEELAMVDVDYGENQPSTSRKWLFAWFTLCLIVAVGGATIFITVLPVDVSITIHPRTKSEQQQQQQQQQDNTVVTNNNINNNDNVWEDWENDRELRESIKQKLKPKQVQLAIANETNPITLLPAKQFAHLHHMKTGGTSFDSLLHCGVRRLELVTKQHAVQGSLNECGYHRFVECMNGNPNCKNAIDRSFVMSFCAPLYSVNHFDWMNSSIVTVLRNPVDRVWSMFRFQTSSCYKCTDLVDIYKMIDNNTINAHVCGHHDQAPCDGVCVSQLINHQSRNLLTSFLDDATEKMDGTKKLNEAIDNLKTKFALIGLTEELGNYTEMIGHAFPFLAENYEGSDKTCKLEHRNSSPRNNHCGPDKTHWDLPPHPDEETRQAIIAHNQIDMALYEAAKKYFSIQKDVYQELLKEEKQT